MHAFLLVQAVSLSHSALSLIYRHMMSREGCLLHIMFRTGLSCCGHGPMHAPCTSQSRRAAGRSWTSLLQIGKESLHTGITESTAAFQSPNWPQTRAGRGQHHSPVVTRNERSDSMRQRFDTYNNRLFPYTAGAQANKHTSGKGFQEHLPSPVHLLTSRNR